MLGPDRPPGTLLLTNGNAHALYWTHTRREFFDAQAACPEAARYALAAIAELYAEEQDILDQRLTSERKRAHRLSHCKPKVDALFE